MRKAPEAPDDIGVVLGPFQAFGMAGRARQLDAAQLVGEVLRMHERQVEEFTQSAIDPRIHAARPHPGQAASARNLRKLLAGSPIRESHRDCGKVQDAYTLRCMPQVHGAVRDALEFVTRTLTIEINAATDNPMVFAESGELLSGGNFHGVYQRFGPASRQNARISAGVTEVSVIDRKPCAR